MRILAPSAFATLLLLCVQPGMAQVDLCGKDPYPRLMAAYSRYGYVVGTENRFKTIKGASIELWSVPHDYDSALQLIKAGKSAAANLIEKTTSDDGGLFLLNGLPRHMSKAEVGQNFEVRVHMPGRQDTAAFLEVLLPQWLGKGLRVALSQANAGCSRVFSAGLTEDAVCTPVDCKNLPAGSIKFVAAGGQVLRFQKLDFFGPPSRMGSPLGQFKFSKRTDAQGFINTNATGCYYVRIKSVAEPELCFNPESEKKMATVMLPPNPNPFHQSLRNSE